MIKYIFFLFLFSAGLFSPLEAIASGGLTHTHTTPALELKPISSITNSYQTAAVCFLGVGDCQQGGYGQGDDDMDTDAGKQCQNAGFTRKTCNAVQDPVKDCAHDTGFVTDCKCKKNLITCATPKFGVGPACDEKYASCQCPATVALSQPNDRCTQNCDGKCIAKTCSRSSNESGCSYGTQNCTDGCGGTRQCCKAAPPCSDTCPSYGSSGRSSGCSYGGEECFDTCGGKWWRNCNSAPAPTPPPSSGGGSGGGSSTPPANPWKYVRSNCRSLMCWDCLNQQYCGSYYQTGYAPTYTCDNHCVNSSTGAKKFICSLGGYGIFSAKAATKAQCQSNMAGLTPPSGESNAGSCNSDGTSSCHY